MDARMRRKEKPEWTDEFLFNFLSLGKFITDELNKFCFFSKDVSMYL